MIRATVAALLLAVAAMAQPAATEPAPAASPLFERHVLEAPGTGRRYEIRVAAPPDYESQQQSYPTIYLADGAHWGPRVRAMLHDDPPRYQPALLVALGDAEGETREYSRRRDYTPSPHGDVDAVSNIAGRPVRYGEAEQFRLFLKQTVIPFVERRYRSDPARRILAGHSYGALFGTHVLLTEPLMFDRYILSSPSLWYGRKLMPARERGYRMWHRDLPAKVFLTIGSHETVPDPATEPRAHSQYDMVGDTQAFAQALRSRNYPSLQLDMRVIPGKDHRNAFPSAIEAGLHWALPAVSNNPMHCPAPTKKGTETHPDGEYLPL